MTSQMIDSAIGSLAGTTLVESSVRLRGRVEISSWLPWSSADKFTHPEIRQPERNKVEKDRFCAES
jgi:hypothetical protein